MRLVHEHHSLIMNVSDEQKVLKGFFLMFLK